MRKQRDVDFVEILRAEGIELIPRGRRLWALCPLHEEAIPSFTVDPEKGLFYCFGCGKGGDVISFIMEFKRFSFKEALVYLGIPSNRRSSYYHSNKKWRIKKKLLQRFEQWQRCLLDFLSELYRQMEDTIYNCKTLDEIETLSWWYHYRPLIEHWLDILVGGRPEDRLSLYKHFRRLGYGLGQ
jgi:DNA primase